MRAWWTQTRAEVRMTVRRGETLLLTIAIPIVLLIFFTTTHVTSTPTPRRIDFFAPGIIALCVMSTSLVALSIATAFERSYGVLRRLYVTPLGRPRLIAAKIAGVVVVEIIQVAVLGVVAAALGWHPHGGVAALAAAAGVLLLATAGFAGVGLALAGRLRAEINLAAANGLYLLLLLGSGFVIPLRNLPDFVQRGASATPSGALADALHRSLGHGASVGIANVVSLTAWAAVAPWIAARAFRFD